MMNFYQDFYCEIKTRRRFEHWHRFVLRWSPQLRLPPEKVRARPIESVVLPDEVKRSITDDLEDNIPTRSDKRGPEGGIADYIGLLAEGEKGYA